MKKAPTNKLDDDLRTEYDLKHLKGDVRGKYYRQATAGTNLVLIDPDVLDVFPDGSAVNQALHALAPVLRRQRRAATKRRSA